MDLRHSNPANIAEVSEVVATHDTAKGMQTATSTSDLAEDSRNIPTNRSELGNTAADNMNSNSMDSNVLDTNNMDPNKMTLNSHDVKDPSAHAQASSAEGKRPSIAPQEAIRRGLSFGPLKKTGSTQSSVPGILKAKSKSPSSRLAQRSLSPSRDALSSMGMDRLKKDYNPNDAGDEEAVDSSDDDDPAESSGDDASASGRARGRIREGGLGQRSTPKSPLAGPTDKPAVTVTGPENEQPKQGSAKRFVVHPNTNFDQSISRPTSPQTSDSEELNDIRRAQNLNINSSPIDSSVPHRVIQTIIRGDFAKMQEEAKEGIRRLRTYLVATDLSGEAAYALEWTIGTVLRDGDTLLAVYAVDEEVGTGVGADSLPIGEGAKAMQDTAAVMEKLTIASQRASLMSPLSKASFRPGSKKSSAANSTDSRALSKAEQERAHAIDKLSETCLRFLRKTKLQIRIAIEVIHCKSPKYMITEAIDGLKPTMTIIGSRGRSALKGVLLGSFSNYLVAKSSAPVMVARKKLSGRKTKHKIASPNPRSIDLAYETFMERLMKFNSRHSHFDRVRVRTLCRLTVSFLLAYENRGQLHLDSERLRGAFLDTQAFQWLRAWK